MFPDRPSHFIDEVGITPMQERMYKKRIGNHKSHTFDIARICTICVIINEGSHGDMTAENVLRKVVAAISKSNFSFSTPLTTLKPSFHHLTNSNAQNNIKQHNPKQTDFLCLITFNFPDRPKASFQFLSVPVLIATPIHLKTAITNNQTKITATDQKKHPHVVEVTHQKWTL